MTLEQPMNLIVDKTADESRRRRNSAVVWFLLGAIFQAGIVALIYKAQSFVGANTTDKLKFFFVISPFVAWLPLAVAVYYFRRSRKSAMRSGNSLYRALTGEPQMIAAIEREPDIVPPEPPAKLLEKPIDDRAGDVAGAIAEGVLEVVLSAAFGSSSDGNSDNDYGSTATSSTASAPLPPRVFVCLTNGERHEISSPLDAAQTVTALRKHAPQAVVAEVAR